MSNLRRKQALCLPDDWQGLGQPQGIARTGWGA